MNNLEKADMIVKAVEVIGRSGWGQGSYQAEPEGKVCMLGSVAYVVGNGEVWDGSLTDDRYHEVVRELEEDLPLTGPPFEVPVSEKDFFQPTKYAPWFNDTPGRTVDEVRDQMMKTVRRLREEK